MQEITLYCSGRDQNVRAVVTDEPRADGQAAVFDTEIICLECGRSCSGGACPVGAMSAEAMDARLAKSGLRPDNHCSFLGRCEACERDTEQVVSMGGYLSCTECGTTRKETVQ